ncbi:15442_t:CDS:10, partial [Entrophospora sp. SA101]
MDTVQIWFEFNHYLFNSNALPKIDRPQEKMYHYAEGETIDCAICIEQVESKHAQVRLSCDYKCPYCRLEVEKIVKQPRSWEFPINGHPNSQNINDSAEMPHPGELDFANFQRGVLQVVNSIFRGRLNLGHPFRNDNDPEDDFFETDNDDNSTHGQDEINQRNNVNLLEITDNEDDDNSSDEDGDFDTNDSMNHYRTFTTSYYNSSSENLPSQIRRNGHNEDNLSRSLSSTLNLNDHSNTASSHSRLNSTRSHSRTRSRFFRESVRNGFTGLIRNRLNADQERRGHLRDVRDFRDLSPNFSSRRREGNRQSTISSRYRNNDSSRRNIISSEISKNSAAEDEDEMMFENVSNDMETSEDDSENEQTFRCFSYHTLKQMITNNIGLDHGLATQISIAVHLFPFGPIKGSTTKWTCALAFSDEVHKNQRIYFIVGKFMDSESDYDTREVVKVLLSDE